MKKMISTFLIAILILSLSAFSFAEEANEEADALENWAYAGITLDNEEIGIGSVYYVAEYFTREIILNPMTVEPYTVEELKAIEENAVAGAEGYITNVPESAVIGISVCGMNGKVFWFDDENSKMILASADPLVLNAENGAVTNGLNEPVAEALPSLENWAYAGITLNSEDFGVSSVYYPASYYEAIQAGELETVNPVTVAPYTEEELREIVSGAVESNVNYVSDVPTAVSLGLGAFNSEKVFWYDGDNAANILSSADPLVLNAETGEVSNLAGEIVATAIL